jgi:5'-methylthioinosine phosphorylase
VNSPSGVSSGSFVNTAIIGGSGFYSLNKDAEPATIHEVSTPYSTSPVSLFSEFSDSSKLWFLPRHGRDHSVPPHLVNYRANLWALKEAGVKNIIAVNAVGGISSNMPPGQIVIPDQIIDYTWGRDHTYFDGLSSLDNHIDFTWPYDKELSAALETAARTAKLNVISKGIYACTQGPRLETAAEVLKLKQDGCDVVGMTGMPEAALARELGLNYSCIALVVNWGAGLTDKEISMHDIQAVLDSGIDEIREIITHWTRCSLDRN